MKKKVQFFFFEKPRSNDQIREKKRFRTHISTDEFWESSEGLPSGDVVAALVKAFDLVVFDMCSPLRLVVAHRQGEAAGDVLREADQKGAPW